MIALLRQSPTSLRTSAGVEKPDSRFDWCIFMLQAHVCVNVAQQASFLSLAVQVSFSTLITLVSQPLLALHGKNTTSWTFLLHSALSMTGALVHLLFAFGACVSTHGKHDAKEAFE